LKFQVEHLEDAHAAQVTAQVEPERVRKHFEAAARDISQKANIPGFRKGKAPYSVILRYFGTQGLLERSLDQIVDEAYQTMLKDTEILAYANGSLEDMKLGDPVDGIPGLELIFLVPKRPEVQLNSYRTDLRIPYEQESVTDEMVDRAINNIREEKAVVEPSSRPVAMGDKVKIKVVGEMQVKHEDYDLTDEQIESDQPASANIEIQEVDEEDEIILRSGKDDEFMPGFSEKLVGMTDGETRSIVIEYPFDFEVDDWANHTVKIDVTVSEIRTMTLPELNDLFAKTASNDRFETLLEFRINIRESLQSELNRINDNQYAQEAIETLTGLSDMAYPEVMVTEFTDDLVKEMENNLRERGLSLETFMSMEKLDMDGLRARYRDLAMSRVERSLALGKLVEEERITLMPEEIDAVIERLIAGLGEQADMFRSMFNQDGSRQNIALDLIKEKAIARLVAIARGENPPIEDQPAAELADSTAATAE
jgi:trigger factor